MEVMTSVVNERLVPYLAKEASTQTLPISDIVRLSFDDEDKWEIYDSFGDDEEEEKKNGLIVPPPARLRVVPELEHAQNPTYRVRSVCSQTLPVSDEEDLKIGSSLSNPRVAAVNAAVQGLAEPLRDESHLHIDFATFDKYILQGSEPFPDDTIETARRILGNEEFLQLYTRYVEADSETGSNDSSERGTTSTAAIVTLIQFIIKHSNSSLATPYLPDQPKLVFSAQLPLNQDENDDERRIDCMPVFLADEASPENCSNSLFLCTFTRQHRTKPIGARHKRKSSTPELEADTHAVQEKEPVQTRKRTRQSVNAAPSRPMTRAVTKLQGQDATSSRNAGPVDKKTPQTRRGVQGKRQPYVLVPLPPKPVRGVEGERRAVVGTSKPPNRAGAHGRPGRSAVPDLSIALPFAGMSRTNQAPGLVSSGPRSSEPIVRPGSHPPPALARLVADVFAAPGCRRHILALSFDQLFAYLWYFDRAGSIRSERIPTLDIRFIATVLRLGLPDRRQAGFEPQIMTPAYGLMGPGVDIAGYRMVVEGGEFVFNSVVRSGEYPSGKTVYLAHDASGDRSRRDSAGATGAGDMVFVELQWPLSDSPRADELVRVVAENNRNEGSFCLYASDVFTRLSDDVRGSIFPGGADRLYLDRELRVQVFGPLSTSGVDFKDHDGLREMYSSVVKCSYMCLIIHYAS